MVVVVGDAGWDVHYEVEHLPSAGQTVSGRLVYQGPAGGSANAAAWCASLGTTVLLAAQVAADGIGERLTLACKATANLRLHVLPGRESTQLTTVLATPDAERTIVVGVPSDAPAGTVVDKDIESCLQKASTALINVEHSPSRSRYRSACGGTALLPMQHFAEELAKGSLWDVLVGSASDHQAPVDADLERLEAQLCVLTMGERGGRYWSKGQWFGFDGYPSVSLKDSTGAGDAFVGGLLAGLERDLTLDEALTLAAWTGARAVEQVGSWPRSALCPPPNIFPKSRVPGE